MVVETNSIFNGELFQILISMYQVLSSGLFHAEGRFSSFFLGWDSDIVVTTTAGLPPSTTTKSEEGSCEDQYPGSCGPCIQFHKVSVRISISIHQNLDQIDHEHVTPSMDVSDQQTVPSEIPEQPENSQSCNETRQHTHEMCAPLIAKIQGSGMATNGTFSY